MIFSDWTDGSQMYKDDGGIKKNRLGRWKVDLYCASVVQRAN